MAQVFISYSSKDLEYAGKIYGALRFQGIDAWLAPTRIEPSEDFTDRISSELADAESIQERAAEIARARVFLLILSGNAMKSIWVPKELTMACNSRMTIIVAQIDHEPLTPGFKLMLINVQLTDCYRMNRNAVTELVERIRKHVGLDPEPSEDPKRFSEQELHIHRLACGDPYYLEKSTLSVRLTGHEFFLAPPRELVFGMDGETARWYRENRFADEDSVFGTTLAEYVRQIPIPDLRERIEASRRKIFLQFLNRENGSHFNNRKYGVEDINPFGRTIDVKETPKLTMRMFITDYYTHRVMKDVCKQLAAEKNRVIREIDFNAIGSSRIFLTSLGINLVLAEDTIHDDCSILVTSRSTNAAETYGKHYLASSVIEGVSASDYDEYRGVVSLNLAAERGLIEELNVTRDYLQMDSLRFYELFVNRDNLEIGITCSVELRREFRLQQDIVPLHGKDQELEIADKLVVRMSALESFVRNNQEAMLPQSVYTLCSYLEVNGVLMIERYHAAALGKQSFICSKSGRDEPCGDLFIDGKDFIAVIDGATPKGDRLWDGKRGDVCISAVLGEAIQSLPPGIEAAPAIETLNQAVGRQYRSFGLDFDALAPEERLQASVLIFSVARKEVWSFGSCKLRINQRTYHNEKKGDELFADLRAFCIEAAELENEDVQFPAENDFGREMILPFLRKHTLFANSGKSFGYDVIDGGRIRSSRVKVYQVQPGDHVVLASDGYPRLFDTLEETEEYLQSCLREDPMCIGKLRGTKGLEKGSVSYDDRCFIGFTVES